jgi:hypothetical protein
MNPIDLVIGRLKDHQCNPREGGTGQWKARCPSHKGKSSNLSVTEGEDGRVLVHCYHQAENGVETCPAEAIVQALGLEMRDLYPPKPEAPSRPPRPERNGNLWRSPEEAVAWVARKAEGQVSQIGPKIYPDQEGEEVFRVYRIDLPEFDEATGKQKKQFLPVYPDPIRNGWHIGDPSKDGLPLYHLDKLAAAEIVYVLEGEECADVVERLGVTTTTSSHGSSGAAKSDWSPLRGKTVYLVPDNDGAGEGYINDVGAILKGLGVQARVIRLPVTGDGHDAKEWLEEVVPDCWGPDECRAELERLAAAATEWAPPAVTDSQSSRRQSAFEPASHRRYEVVTMRASKVRLQPVEFLDGGVIPLGKLITLAGLGGAGKGMFWANLVADLTQGRQTFGLDYVPRAAIDVLLVGVEDGDEDTVVPRLAAAGADLERVHFLKGIKDEEGRILPFSLAYLAELEKYLADNPAIGLVVIDPIAGYVARAGVKDHHDAEVRTLLEPLADLANRYRVTIVAIKHLNKDEAKTLASRVGGSIAYVNVPRACFVIADDPRVKGQRVLAPFKWNLNASIPGAIAWTMELMPAEEAAEVLAIPNCAHLDATKKAMLAAQLNRLQWVGAVNVDANDLLKTASKAERQQTRAEVDRATEWLRERLKGGPAGSILCAREGDKFLGRRWLAEEMPSDKRQRIVLGRVKWWRENVVKARLAGSSSQAGFHGPWMFRLPDHAWPPAPEVVEAAQQATDDALNGPGASVDAARDSTEAAHTEPSRVKVNSEDSVASVDVRGPGVFSEDPSWVTEVF